MSALLQPIVAVINMVVSVINGLIVGAITFLINLLDGVDSIDSLIEHLSSAIAGFFTSILNLGTGLFPFLPVEWVTMVEVSLIVLVIGMIIKKKVVG